MGIRTVFVPQNVWSAARLQGKSEMAVDRSAQMYAAFKWRVVSPGHDELRCVLFLINGTVMVDHLREQVSSMPLGTVRSSWLSSADPWWEFEIVVAVVR
jgi:hypothetical protein